MKKIFSTLFGFAALSLGLASCSEDVMDTINKDLNHATDVSAKFIVTDLITNTAINIVGGDLNTYASVAVEHEGGVFNQLYNAETRVGEWNTASCFNNSWSNIYNNIKNAQIVIAKTADDSESTDAGNAAIRGVAEVILAHNSAVLTDLFGDAPYSEAAKGAENMNPALDTQQSIYQSLMATLDKAIADLQAGGSNSGLGSFDYLYGGDNSKWLKFAYGLKARLLMHTIYRASDKASVYNQILSLIDQSFADPSEDAEFNVYDSSNWNPTFDFQYSRDYFGFSQSMYNKMMARNDKRITRILFEPYGYHLTPDSDDLLLVPNGEDFAPVQWEYSFDAYCMAMTASTYLLSYYELQFLKAECLARLGRDAEAKACVKIALELAFENTEASVQAALASGQLAMPDDDESTALTAADADEYFANIVEPLSGDALLAEIMVQKYLAMYGANGESLETYNDIRRMKALGENFVELENPKNSSKFPLRYGYGSSDTTTNPNVQAAFGNGQYVFSEPVWWAGGSR